jgi:hypothetical protein
MLANPKSAELLQTRIADVHGTGAHAPCVGVMEDDDRIVRSQPQIALNSRADLERRSEGDQAVFRKSGAVVHAAMGEPRSTRIKWVRL